MDTDKSQLIQHALPLGTELKGGKKTYRIEKVLGVGGFGITYKVSSITMDGNIRRKHYYAVKEHFMKGCYRGEDATSVGCPPTLKNDIAQSRDDFENEAERLMNLSNLSSNIVKVNEKFKANGTCYYVMEYLDGGDWEKLVKQNKGALTEAKALSLIIPIAKAVSLLHSGEKRLLHLDIKPDNIVMKTDEISGATYPVLIDFGTAKHFDRKGRPTSLPTAKGATEGFAPIEQYAEITAFDGRLDVYALGATLFYLLTGRRPVKAWDISNDYILSSIPPTVSERTRQAIKNAMQKDKESRTPSVAMFLKEIEKTYTLPLYYELQSPHQKYRIIELLSENAYSITYKAVVSRAVSPMQVRDEVANGNQTIAHNYYILCECYSQQFNERTDKGTVVSLVRYDSGIVISPQQQADSHNHGIFLDEARLSLGIPPGKTLSPDKEVVFSDKGEISGEIFQANGTQYYAKKPPKPTSVWVNLARGLSSLSRVTMRFAKKNRIVLVAVLCIGSMAYFVSWLGTGSTSEDSDSTSYRIENDSIRLIQGPGVQLLDPQDTKEEVNDPRGEEKLTPIKETTPTPHNLTPVPATTDDDLFASAKDIADFKHLAEKGYKKAYYPLAEIYYRREDYKSAQHWASKAVSSKIDISEAEALLKKTVIAETNIKWRAQQEEQHQRFAKAVTIADYKALADEGYAKAYAPLANLYLRRATELRKNKDSKGGGLLNTRQTLILQDYDNADKYAKKALNVNVDRETAISVINILDDLGYYDDKSHVKPKI